MSHTVTHRKGLIALVLLLVLVSVLGWLAWDHLLRTRPQELADDSIEEYFKYGSVGTEEAAGIPLWIWLVLPKMFPEYLPAPGGWAALGFVWEQGRELPVGFSKKTIGFPRVGINCALCHSATLRTTADAAPQVFLGGPSSTIDALAYQRFLFQAASDPRFTSGNILASVSQITKLSLIDRLLYRFVLVPQTRKALLEQKEAFAWTETRPDWGRGRIDPFNPPKIAILNVPVGDTIGNADMQAIWNLRPRAEAGRSFHWDGLNTDLREVIISSALGDGATKKSLPLAALERIETWTLDLQPPSFANFFPIDQTLATAGVEIFTTHCAACHRADSTQTGTVLVLGDVAWEGGETDSHRAEMWTPEAATAYNAFGDGYPWYFSHFRSTGGYVNVPLDGIWLRAPYLHNGSVPYLDELLERPAMRTTVFYRGFDVYNPDRMGFVAEGADAERVGTRLDTRALGNSNRGHLWGTDLAPEQKRALLEYLKTL